MNPDMGGHGIAHHLHMPPRISFTAEKEEDYEKRVMEPGMAFTIEPILMMQKDFYYIMWKDDWTIQTPGIPSAGWEHIILITENGHEILTKREGEKSPFEEKVDFPENLPKRDIMNK